MSLGNILSALEGVRQHGDSYQARCPAHDDRRASLTVSTGKDGKVLLHCHAGCTPESILAAMKLGWECLFVDAANPTTSKSKPQIVQTYDYHDAKGELLFQTVRYLPKDFRQRRPDGRDWTWNLRGVTPVLYRLPYVLAAEDVFVTEGEKDADRLAALGLCATTSPMGAGKWKPHYNDWLRGKRIAILPDNDEPGRKHAHSIAAGLLGIAASVKVVDLPVPVKGDVSDWLSNGGSKESLLQLLKSAPVFGKTRDAVPMPSAGDATDSEVPCYADAVLEDHQFVALSIPPKRAHLAPWLCEGSITLVVGWRGIGKTWFALFALDAVTRSVPFGPWKCETGAPCLYLDGEMAAADVMDRLNSIGTAGRKFPLYIYSDAHACEMGLPRANLGGEKWRQGMKGLLIERGVKLWVVDNIASLTPGMDENSKQEWDSVNRWLLDLRFAGISTVLLHHEGKEGRQRGTSAREDNIDVSIALQKPANYTPEDGARFIVRFSKHRIRTRDLPLIADTEFQVTEGNDLVTYTWGDVRRQNKLEILRLSDQEIGVTDIASALGVAKSYVTKIRQGAVKDGFLSKSGKLTQAGFSHVYGN